MRYWLKGVLMKIVQNESKRQSDKDNAIWGCSNAILHTHIFINFGSEEAGQSLVINEQACMDGL